MWRCAVLLALLTASAAVRPEDDDRASPRGRASRDDHEYEEYDDGYDYDDYSEQETKLQTLEDL
jgi:hypothetical protein